MQLNNLIDGLTILSKYYDNVNGYHIGAEHDQFYAYATDIPVSKDDVEKLKSLGWFQPDGNEEYNPAEGWSAFT